MMSFVSYFSFRTILTGLLNLDGILICCLIKVTKARNSKASWQQFMVKKKKMSFSGSHKKH